MRSRGLCRKGRSQLGGGLSGIDGRDVRVTDAIVAVLQGQCDGYDVQAYTPSAPAMSEEGAEVPKVLEEKYGESILGL